MPQKVIKIGTSAGVTISQETLKELGLKPGDNVEVGVDKKNKSVVITPVANVDKELIDWTQKFIDRYKKDLEELGQK